MNFQADTAKQTLTAAFVLGLKTLPGDLSNTLGERTGPSARRPHHQLDWYPRGTGEATLGR